MARVVPGESSRLHNAISLGQLELYECGVSSVEKADLGLAVTTMPRTWERRSAGRGVAAVRRSTDATGPESVAQRMAGALLGRRNARSATELTRR